MVKKKKTVLKEAQRVSLKGRELRFKPIINDPAAWLLRTYILGNLTGLGGGMDEIHLI